MYVGMRLWVFTVWFYITKSFNKKKQVVVGGGLVFTSRMCINRYEGNPFFFKEIEGVGVRPVVCLYALCGCG